MLTHLRRFLGFSLIPAFSLLASLVLLPLVSGGDGAHGVVALVVGQSVGAILGVMNSLAWPVLGGHAVAVADAEERRRLFAVSVYSRLMATTVLLPFGVGACVLLVSEYTVATSLFMAGIALNGMTMGWFYSGLGEPRRLVLHEGVVRLVGYAVAGWALSMGAPLVTYAAITTVSAVTSLVLNWTYVMGWRTGPVREISRQAVSTLVEHREGTLARVLQATFYYGGPTIFASLSPGSLSVFAAMDQMQKASANAVAVFPQSAVSFVSGDPKRQWRRGHLAWAFISVAGLAVVITWTALGPEAVRLLFSGEVHISRWGCTLVGLAVCAGLIAKSYELLILVPMGLAKTLFRIDSAFSVVGVVAVAGSSLTGSAYLTMSVWSVVNVCLLAFVLIVGRRQRELELNPVNTPPGEPKLVQTGFPRRAPR